MLYKMFYNYGMSVAVRYAGNKDLAGEIYNDSLLKVFKNIRSYNPEKSFKGWVRKIIIHTAIDLYRKELKHINYNELDDYENIFYQNNTSEKLMADDIIRLIHSLPNIYRIVFNLYELEGYAHDEIATMLEITESTSRSCLSRAKNKLRYLIAEQYEKPK